MVDYAAMIDACQSRVIVARRVADQCRGDQRIHRAAMNAVSVLEDTLYVLEAAVADLSSRASGNNPAPERRSVPPSSRDDRDH